MRPALTRALAQMLSGEGRWARWCTADLQPLMAALHTDDAELPCQFCSSVVYGVSLIRGYPADLHVCLRAHEAANPGVKPGVGTADGRRNTPSLADLPYRAILSRVAAGAAAPPPQHTVTSAREPFLTSSCFTTRGVTLRFQRDQAKAMQRYFQQQKAAEIADRSQCAPFACPSRRLQSAAVWRSGLKRRLPEHADRPCLMYQSGLKPSL